jgi:hypothetical protein
MIRSLVAASAVLALVACATPGERASPRYPSTASEERAAAWLEAHRDRPPMLRAFLHAMPKGGDIHTHLSGAVYAESYIAWAAQAHLCVHTTAGTLAPPPCDPARGLRPVADALQDADFYGALIDGLSTRNLADRPQSGHNQFFAAFRRFAEATVGRGPEMVAEVAARGADQQASYLELMVTLRGGDVRALAQKVQFDAGDFAATRQRLLSAGLADIVKGGSGDLDQLEREANRLLECGPAPAPAACGVVRRYLQQSSRGAEPGVVFAQLLYAFELAAADRRVVGINLVAPEDDRIALRDYHLQMQMVGWLAGAYPGVNIALHAGELTLGLVRPEDLRFHVREAIEVAGARRIGHGVDIGYERDAVPLMQVMKERRVLVEICLTSNDVILGVKGPQHPFPDLLRAGVPVTLATDDEGVSRTDLTNEYLRATLTYGLGYRELKNIARNSLTYSFLEGASLWDDGATRDLAAPCAGARPGLDPPDSCRRFLDVNPKARLQWALENAFGRFEASSWLR